MNIQNFLSTLDGRWLTQQTALNIYLGKNTTNKCEVTYKYISHIEPSLVSSFDKQQYSSMDIQEILWGNRSLDLSSSILYSLYFFTYRNSFNGKFVKWNSNELPCYTVGLFNWNTNDILSMRVIKNTTEIEEKIHIPSTKLRLATSIIKKFGICTHVSFMSEIKLKNT